MKQYDYLLVGSGLFAGVFAYFAGKQGKKCLVLEKRDHLGGNIYCEETEGIHVHKYGAHIFHKMCIRDSLDALLALEAESFTEEAPVGKEEIRMTVFLDNENYPQVTVALYRYDGEYCLAEVDGEPVSLVPRSQAVDLTEAVHGIVLSGGNK